MRLGLASRGVSGHVILQLSVYRLTLNAPRAHNCRIAKLAGALVIPLKEYGVKAHADAERQSLPSNTHLGPYPLGAHLANLAKDS